MRDRSLLFLLAATTSLAMQATQWSVGPGEAYTAPSQVAALVGNGDTVNIAAGVYPSDVTNWTADDLLLRGVGGRAHLESNGNAWGNKGIWVIQGDRTTVEWIEFSECSVPDHNGAGIRMEGKHLTVRHCYFHYNENGILAGTPNASPSNITIEHCEFAHNGFGDGFSHNLYINHTDTLWFRYNYSHHTNVGHELKSRAHVNVIEYNRFSNEQNGNASREIDLPDGGQAYLIGNVLHQGQQGQNSNMIGFGLESMSNPGPHELFAINNTLVNERTVGSFFSMNSATAFKAYSNILAGQGQFVANFFPLQTDTAGNLKEPVFALIGFADPNNYDYHIDNASPAHNRGIPAGYSNSGYALVAWDEYVHPRVAPCAASMRCSMPAPSRPAPRACRKVGQDIADAAQPVQGLVHIAAPAGALMKLFDAQGRLLRSAQSTGIIAFRLLAAVSHPVRMRCMAHEGSRSVKSW
ncbi:MAG: hypothetical protein R2818_08225 [Flavobacteriales bacterium]